VSDPEHPSPNPLAEDAPDDDRVGLAANAMAAAMAVAVAAISLVAFATRRAAANSGITSRENIVDSLAVNIVIYGTVAGVFVAGGVAWVLMKPIDSNYRRGGLSMVGAFGGFLLSVILTMLVRGLLSDTALPGLALVAALIAVFFARRARAAA
jgi:hypothetical protein